MELRDHIVQGIKFLKSPNFNIRPENLDIDLLVIHSISLPPTTLIVSLWSWLQAYWVFIAISFPG